MTDIPRRSFVAAMAGATSGCFGSVASGQEIDVPAEWPLVGSDPGNQHGASGTIDGKPSTSWSFEPSNRIVGSPVVRDGHVFVSTEQVVHRIEVSTGERNWWTRLNETISGAPATSSGRVYVAVDSFGSESARKSGALYRIDPSSDTVDWRFETGSRRVFTPIAVGDTVYVRTTAGLTAVATDGTRRWNRTDVPQFSALDRRYANELVPCIHDGTVVVPTPTSIVALDAASGTRQWEYPVEKCRVGPTVADDGTVFVTDVAQGVVALSADNGSELWTWEAENVWGGTGITEEALLVTTGAELVALDRQEGAERWRFRIDGDSHGSPTTVGTTALVGSTAGTLSAVSIEGGELQWQLAAGDGYYLPIAAANRLHVAAFGSLHCLG